MNPIRFLLIILFSLTTLSCAAPPTWFTSNEFKWVDPATHIIGVGSGMSYDDASERAGGDLAGQIEIQIQTQSQSIVSSYIEDDREQIREAFMSASKSFTSVSIRGAQIIDKVQDGDKFYVLMALEKESFVRELRSELDQKKAVIDRIRSDSKELMGEGKIFEAIDLLLDTEELVAALLARAAIHNAFATKSYDIESLAGPAIISEARKAISKIKLEKVSGNDQTGKSGEMLSEPFVVRVYSDDGDVAIPAMRLCLKDESGKIVERQYSDDAGRVEFYAYALGDKKGRQTVGVDLRKIPKLFRGNLKGLEVSFIYELGTVVPVAFTVKVEDEQGRRIPKVEQTIAKSVTKLGHVVSDQAPFWLSGRMEPVEAHQIDGFDGAMYQVKTELDLFMKSKITDETVGTITISADGLHKQSGQKAIEASYQKLKVSKKEMARLLANAASELEEINGRISAQEYQQGQALYDQGKYRDALAHLTRVSVGDQVAAAKKLIQQIKNEFWEAAKHREKLDQERREQEVKVAEAKARKVEAAARIQEAMVQMAKIKAELERIDKGQVTSTNPLSVNDKDVITAAVKLNQGYQPQQNNLAEAERKLVGTWTFVGAVEINTAKESYEGAGRVLKLSGDHTFLEADTEGRWEADGNNFSINGFSVPYVFDPGKLIIGFNISGSQYMMVYLR